IGRRSFRRAKWPMYRSSTDMSSCDSGAIRISSTSTRPHPKREWSWHANSTTAWRKYSVRRSSTRFNKNQRSGGARCLTDLKGGTFMTAALTGKTAFVTAAGQGIGRATALALAAAGAQVIATDVDEAKVRGIASDSIRIAKLNVL